MQSSKSIIHNYICTGIAALFFFAAAAALFAQETDSLNHYLRIADGHNPAIQAAVHDHHAALQKIPQAGAYQDLQLEMGVFPEPMELVGGREIARFQVMQMFPWFGARKAAKQEAQQMAKMAFQQLRETRDRIALQVYTQWFVLCRLQQKLINRRENAALLKQLETLAIGKLSAGGNVSVVDRKPAGAPSTETPPASGMEMGSRADNLAMAQQAGQAQQAEQAMTPMAPMNDSGNPSALADVLRIQLEIAESDYSIGSLLSEIAAGKALFNALLNRPAESEVVIPDHLLQLPYTAEEALHTVAGQNPMLGMLENESLAWRAKATMTDRMSYPMLGIGLQYMFIGRTKPDMNAMNGANAMNGKDMLMPMASLTIPLYREKYRAAKKEAGLRRQAAEAKYADALNMLEAEWSRYQHQLADAARKIERYRRQEALANTACDLLVQAFAANRGDLGSVLQMQRQRLDYRLNVAEAIADYNTQVVNIRKITSTITVNLSF
jgi:outer membrane protein TolC